MSNEITLTNNPKSSLDMFDIMEKCYKFAQIMSKSDIIPVHYRGKPENTFIAVQTAHRMDIDPMLVMQNTFVVSGKLGMNSTFAIALANKSRLFKGGIRYREQGSGDTLQVTAYAILKAYGPYAVADNAGEEISYTISMKQAKAEGWTKNSKYQTLPELMLRYRAATFLIRTHMPEVLNGMHMVEELEDVVAATAPVKNVTSSMNNAQSLSDKLGAILDESQEIPQEIEEVATVIPNMQDVEPLEYQTILYERLKALVDLHEISPEKQAAWCAKAGVMDIQELPEDAMQKCISHLSKEYGDVIS